jgi:hypothetical protein
LAVATAVVSLSAILPDVTSKPIPLKLARPTLLE